MVPTITRRNYSLLAILFISSIFYTSTSAQQQFNGILNMRQDTTCSGGTCDLGNVCCGNGCMFSTGVCCAGSGDYFCYQGETCQGPNDVGDVNCCSDGSCTPAKFVIYYADSGTGGASASGSSAPTSTPVGNSGAAPSSPPTSTENSASGAAPSTSPAPLSSASSQPSGAAPTTEAAGPTATGGGGVAGGSPTTSSAAPATTSKSSAAWLTSVSTLEGGVSFLLLTLLYYLY